MVTLQNNGGDDLSVSANGEFTFSTCLPGGIRLQRDGEDQPDGSACTVANGSGTIGSASVTNVAVTCTASTAVSADDFNRADGHSVPTGPT